MTDTGAIAPAVETINPGGIELRPLLTRPKTVAIVALGLSAKDYLYETMSNKWMKNKFDEVWAINRGVRGMQHDKVFVMDDLRWLEKHAPPYAEVLRKHDKPIITSTAYPEYPMAVPYPIMEVLDLIKDDIFTHNTVAYAVAYAMAIGVEHLYIYGADFIYPNGNFAEAGGQAIAFLLGIARGEGKTNFHIPGSSTLLYSNTAKVIDGTFKRPWYGYHRKQKPEGGSNSGLGA